MTDREFLDAFEAAAIPRDRWTHRAHVRVAFLYTRALPLAEAIVRVRSGIQALNRANGVHDTPTAGYHETVTVAWAMVVADRIRSGGGHAGSFDAFADEHQDLFGKDFLSRFYSKDRLFSAEARASFVPPDVGTLPQSSSRDQEPRTSLGTRDAD